MQQQHAASVYLAGPISGLSYRRARMGWRAEFAALLPENVTCWSPMRSDDHMKGTRKIGTRPRHGNVLECDKAILARDFFDVANRDVLVACFLESGNRISVGTQQEIGMAYALRKPIVLIAKPGDPNADHPFTRAAADFSCTTLAEAAAVVRHLCCPGV